MGDPTDDLGRTVAARGTTAVLADPAIDVASSEPAQHDIGPSQAFADGRRRFTTAVLAGIGVAAVPFIWILWSLWGPTSPIRKTAYENNFFDLQTRAMFHGHLWLAKGSIGIEAFIHSGRQYTYFGLFPSIIRMPIMAVTSSLDGRLSAPFMLLAWMLTGLFASLLMWRVRILIRDQAPVSRAEALSFGVLMTTFMGGSVFLLLAASPFVFAEDLAWSVCLTVGSIFALLGVLERPSWGRVIASGVFILSANFDRVTTGWACVIAAVLIAGWFRISPRTEENRRWWLPVLGAGLVPLVAGCAVNYAKFGVPFGVSNFDQLYTQVNAYRRRFLAANHNSEAGTAFIPSTLLAYLRPDGLRLTSVFPFITLPGGPPRALSGVLFDRRYRTASLPASMPLLFLLSCWGSVTAFRRNPVGRVALTRILLFSVLIAGGALMIWGYIAPRYLADFMPFLVLASSVAMVDIWRRLEGRSRSVRVWASAAIVAVALFTIAANVGIAVTPNEEWTPTQVLHYVEAQKAFSDVTGHPLSANVVRRSALPPWGPADQLIVIGDCDGLYISNGEDYSAVPAQQFQRTTWMAVQRGQAFEHAFRVTFNNPPGAPVSLPLVSAGSSEVAVTVSQAARHRPVRVTFGVYSPHRRVYGISAYVTAGSTHVVVVITDPAQHLALVTLDGTAYVSTTLTNGEPVYATPGRYHSSGAPPTLAVVNDTGFLPRPSLCQSLIP